jgi:uncharacterized damage-inducible protein DinB
MPSPLADRFCQWYEYEHDSHEKVIASLEAVPGASHGEAAFRKAVDLLAHIAAARELWLYRFGVASTGPAMLFPQQVGLAEAIRRIRAVEPPWTAYLAKLNDEELARRFEYKSTEGPRFRSSVEEILTQLFGHSWYHRGQIASLVRSLGCQPAETDFVFWSREPVDPPHSRVL